MSWAEDTWAATTGSEQLRSAVEPERAAAAAAMLILTGDDSWNDVFQDATGLGEGTAGLAVCPGGTCDAVWIYASAPADLTRPTLRSNAVETIRQNADAIVAGQATTAFGWAMEHPAIPIVWGLGPSIPHGLWLIRAYAVTGDEAYRAATVRATSFSLGANPLGVSFATGLGTTNVRNPLMVDVRRGLQPAPGTFVYGIHDLAFGPGDDWFPRYFLEPAGIEPSPEEFPLLRSFYDLGVFPAMSEFTVYQSHASALWTLGALAATG